MIKIVFVLIYITSLYSITGLEIAQKMENRAKPIDIKSKNTMILTNKKGKKKTSKLISQSKDDSKKQMIWFLEPKDDYGISFLKIEHDDDDDFMNMWLPGFKKIYIYLIISGILVLKILEEFLHKKKQTPLWVQI